MPLYFQAGLAQSTLQSSINYMSLAVPQMHRDRPEYTPVLLYRGIVRAT